MTVKADGTVLLNNGDRDNVVQQVELAPELRKLLDEKRSEKIVFVDFEDPVAWGDTVSIMDTIRGIATDTNHDEVKVALKLREDAAQQQQPAPQ